MEPELKVKATPEFRPPKRTNVLSTKAGKEAFTREVKELFLQKMGETQNTLLICKEMGIPWGVFYAHYAPVSKYYDEWFAGEVEAQRKKFGYDLMENVLFPMAKVKKTSHFNYTIASLKAVLPEHFDRNRVQIGIVANDVNVKWGDGSFDPLKLREKQEITQEELSFRSGIHRTYMGRVERGKQNLSLLNIMCL